MVDVEAIYEKKVGEDRGALENKEDFDISGKFEPSKKAENILEEGDILAKEETPTEMLRRVVEVVRETEKKYFGTDQQEATEFGQDMLDLFLERKVVPSTPIMTNANRFEDRPLSACSVPPVDLNNDFSEIKREVDTYHEEGMGTGFALDKAENPIEVLEDLQKIAKTGLEKEEQHRPVGNIGVMKVYNPQIKEFIKIKQQNQERDWKFNLSVDMTDEFMEAYYQDEFFELRDGRKIDSQELMDLITNCAWDCADPGLVFLDNMNRRRPFNKDLNYVSVAPCGEVGLAEGETCQFASINISEFEENEEIAYSELAQTVESVTRFLDDVLEYSIEHYSYEESVEAMKKSRKIGIGLCGYSELLTSLGLKYDSKEANQLLKDALSFINYVSKEASIELAQERGTFDGWEDSKYSESTFLYDKFGQENTRTVKSDDWLRLDQKIQERGLRNSTTVILPPTGRSALTFDTSQQIEPIFNLVDQYGHINEEFREKLKELDVDQENILERVYEHGSCQNIDELPGDFKDVFRTAVEIGYEEHFNVLVEAQQFVDESVSKTINLPKDVSPETIEDIYVKAYEAGLNGVTVYRNGSFEEQPKDLKER